MITSNLYYLNRQKTSQLVEDLTHEYTLKLVSFLSIVLLIGLSFMAFKNTDHFYTLIIFLVGIFNICGILFGVSFWLINDFIHSYLNKKYNLL